MLKHRVGETLQATVKKWKTSPEEQAVLITLGRRSVRPIRPRRCCPDYGFVWVVSP